MDRARGKPEYERWVEKGEIIEYRFKMLEFIEAFLGDYKAEDLTKYLSPHFSECEQTESFMKQLENAHLTHRLSILGYNPFRIIGINFDIMKVVPQLPKEAFYEPTIEGDKKRLSEHLRTLSNGRANVRTSPELRRKATLEVIRLLRAMNPPIGTLRSHGHISLGDFAMIKSYNLPTDNLRIVRLD